MKKIFLLLILGISLSMTSLTSCNRQTCPAYQGISQHAQSGGKKKKKKKKARPLSTKRGKTNLFPKNMRN